MKTTLFFNFNVYYNDIKIKTEEWRLTGNWAIFESSKNLSLEIEYIGPFRIFNKLPKTLWIHEDNVEIGYINEPRL